MRLHSILVALALSLAVETAWAQQPPASPPAQPSAENPQQAAPAGKAEQLPEVVVTQESQTQKKKKAPHKPSAAKGPSAPAAPSAAATAAAGSQASASTAAGPLAVETQALDAARDTLLTQIGTNAFSINREALEAIPQGTNAPVSKVLLQAPGVTQELGRERPDPRSQRARQPAVPYQWHYSARRGLGL